MLCKLGLPREIQDEQRQEGENSVACIEVRGKWYDMMNVVYGIVGSKLQLGKEGMGI